MLIVVCCLRLSLFGVSCLVFVAYCFCLLDVVVCCLLLVAVCTYRCSLMVVICCCVGV